MPVLLRRLAELDSIVEQPRLACKLTELLQAVLEWDLLKVWMAAFGGTLVFIVLSAQFGWRLLLIVLLVVINVGIVVGHVLPLGKITDGSPLIRFP